MFYLIYYYTFVKHKLYINLLFLFIKDIILLLYRYYIHLNSIYVLQMFKVKGEKMKSIKLKDMNFTDVGNSKDIRIPKQIVDNFDLEEWKDFTVILKEKEVDKNGTGEQSD